MDSTEYAPGTVAVATVRGVTGTRVFRIGDDSSDMNWRSALYISGSHFHSDSQVADVRPLVVLDLNESVGKSLLPDWLRNNIAKVEEGCSLPTSIGKDLQWLADQIDTQLNPKPPRIPEPGLWGVVEASTSDTDRREWVRHKDGAWIADGYHRRSVGWVALESPTLIREGLS